MKRLKINLNLIILLYLYIPILVFLFGWIKWYIAIGATIMFLMALNELRKENQVTYIKIHTYKGVIALLLSMLFLMIWCIFSGQGAYVSQAGDWGKHNVLLEDLIHYEWPVRYDLKDGGIMDYYIAGYLLPALIGKIYGGVNTAEFILLIWVCAGLLLTCISIYVYLGCKSEWKLLLICGVLVTFSTFIVPLSGLYRILCPEDVGDGYHWLSSSIRIQYSSNIILLRWVFPQFVPTIVAVIGLLLNRNQIGSWGIFCAPIVLYSTFCFVGIVALVLEFIVVDWFLAIDKKRFASKLLGWGNLYSVVVALVLCIYILGNVLQPKPDSVAMKFSLIDYSGHEVLWIVFQMSWILWCLILIKKESKNHLLYCSGIILFLLPFGSLGIWNDFVMRCSIPALFVLCILVTKNVVDIENERFYKNLLIGCLVLNVFGGGNELMLALKSSGMQEDNRWKYASSEEFLLGEYGWQYVNWDEKNSIVQWVLK